MTQRNRRQLPFEQSGTESVECSAHGFSCTGAADPVLPSRFRHSVVDSEQPWTTDTNSRLADSSSPARAASVRPSSAHSADWIMSCTHAMHHARCPHIDWTAVTSSVACCGLSAAEEWRKIYRLDHLMHACHACWSPAPTSACMEDCGTPIRDRSKMHALGHGD